MADQTTPECPYPAAHGNPFRYCACGWTETPNEDTTAGSGSSRRAQEPGADLVSRVAQAMRDANTPAAWAQVGRPVSGAGPSVPFEVYARAAVDEMTRCAQERDPLSPPPGWAFVGAVWQLQKLARTIANSYDLEAQDRADLASKAERVDAELDKLAPDGWDGFTAGYAQAVARLRDDERYRSWWSATTTPPGQAEYWDGWGRGHLADYLETVGPDGPMVTLLDGTLTWQPARPGDTPGQLVPGEGDTPPPVDGRAQAVYDQLAAAKPGEVFDFEQRPGQRVLVVVARSYAVEPTTTEQQRLADARKAPCRCSIVPHYAGADPLAADAPTVDQHNNAEADHG